MGRDPRDYVPNYGEYMSEETQASLKESEKKVRQEEKARKKEERRQEKLTWSNAPKSDRRVSGIKYIVGGVGVFAIGALLTWGSLALSATAGFGSYFLFYGAFIAGIFMVVKGAWRVVTNFGADLSTR